LIEINQSALSHRLSFHARHSRFISDRFTSPMRLNRTARLLTAWTAAFAMLVVALAPVLSQMADRASGDVAWLEICTASGIRHVPADAGSQDPADDGDRAAGPCMFCSLSAGVLPTPSCALDVPAAQGGDAVAALGLHLPRPRLPWPASHPRAPPVRA